MAEETDAKFREPKTIQQTLKPVIYLSWLMGTGICRPCDQRKLTICLKFCHLLMCTTVVAYGVEDFITATKSIWSEAYLIMHVMNKTLIYIVSYYYVFFGVFHYKKWERFVRRFEILDENVRREITIDDRGTEVRVQIMAFGVMALLGPLPLLFHVVYYHLYNPRLIYTSDLLFYYIITQSLATNLGFDVMVHRIYLRFKIVNKLVKQIEDSSTAPWMFVMKIKRLRDLHHGICDLVTILNEAHGVHLLLSSANSFLIIVVTLFRIYIRATQSNLSFILMNNFIWIVYVVQFGMNCYVCTLTTREAKRAGILLHGIELKNNQPLNKPPCNKNSENKFWSNYQPEAQDSYGSYCMQNEIARFSSQLEHNPVAFSACDFFQLNNALFQGFVGVIVTYLIILIQFCHPRKSY